MRHCFDILKKIPQMKADPDIRLNPGAQCALGVEGIFGSGEVFQSQNTINHHDVLLSRPQPLRLLIFHSRHFELMFLLSHMVATRGREGGGCDRWV